MARKQHLLTLLLAGLCLVGCGAAVEPTPDRVATRVAEDKAVAATLTADAAANQATTVATNAPTATTAPTAANLPTANAVPTPTPIIIVDAPVDGQDGNLTLRGSRAPEEGRNLLLPGFSRADVTDPMVFDDRIAARVEVFDPAVGRQDGDGIATVTFSISDENGTLVHEQREETAPYCLFGGNEPLCTTLTFAENDYRWPNGASITNGQYETAIVIQPRYGEPAIWVWRFQVEAANSPYD
ncbi:MAG: hypothetical protein M3Q45_11775 [Chloroflexota bacterium]|nr:hypothetical protein [Chloroflexota bacterium]